MREEAVFLESFMPHHLIMGKEFPSFRAGCRGQPPGIMPNPGIIGKWEVLKDPEGPYLGFGGHQFLKPNIGPALFPETMRSPYIIGGFVGSKVHNSRPGYSFDLSDLFGIIRLTTESSHYNMKSPSASVNTGKSIQKTGFPLEMGQKYHVNGYRKVDLCKPVRETMQDKNNQQKWTRHFTSSNCTTEERVSLARNPTSAMFVDRQYPAKSKGAEEDEKHQNNNLLTKNHSLQIASCDQHQTSQALELRRAMHLRVYQPKMCIAEFSKPRYATVHATIIKSCDENVSPDKMSSISSTTKNICDSQKSSLDVLVSSETVGKTKSVTENSVENCKGQRHFSKLSLEKDSSESYEKHAMKAEVNPTDSTATVVLKTVAKCGECPNENANQKSNPCPVEQTQPEPCKNPLIAFILQGSSDEDGDSDFDSDSDDDWDWETTDSNCDPDTTSGSETEECELMKELLQCSLGATNLLKCFKICEVVHSPVSKSDDSASTSASTSVPQGLHSPIDEVDAPIYSDCLISSDSAVIAQGCSEPLLPILEVNEKWNSAMSEYESIPKDRDKMKVTFAPEESLVSMIEVDGPETVCRKGEWEQKALDHMRFKERIKRSEPILSKCLGAQHRQKMYKLLHAEDEETQTCAIKDCALLLGLSES